METDTIVVETNAENLISSLICEVTLLGNTHHGRAFSVLWDVILYLTSDLNKGTFGTSADFCQPFRAEQMWCKVHLLVIVGVVFGDLASSSFLCENEGHCTV